MSETAVKLAFGDFGGTGVRGYAVDPLRVDLANCDSFTIPLEQIEGDGHLQELVDENFRRMADEGDFRYGGAVLAVDGPEDREFRLGVFKSHKTKQRIDPRITAGVLDCPAEAMNDVMAMAHGLKTVTADEVAYILKAPRREIKEGFKHTRTVVVTASSGVGGSLFNPQPDGSVQITSLHNGHQGYQPGSHLEEKVLHAMSAAQKADGHSGLVSVEQVVSGGNILQVADVIDADYAAKLREEHDGNFDTVGRSIARHAISSTDMYGGSARSIMKLRASVLGTAVRDYAAACEAQAVVLTGGGMKGLEPWIGPDSLFQQRVSALHPDHAYKLGHIVLGPQDLSLRGGLQAARELAYAGE